MTISMKYLTLASVSVLLISSPCFAGDTFNPFTGSPDRCVTIKEIDGSPENIICGDLKVSNGALTDNGDGTYTLTTGVGGGGDVSGPGSSTDNATVRFDGAGGKTLQNSGVIIDDADNVSGVTSINIDGATGNTLVVDTSTLVVNATSNNVGIGTTGPTQKLDVAGTVKATEFSGPLTGNVTGNASGSAASITGDLDPDQLSGDTTDDNLVDDAIIASTIARDSEVSSAIATKDECSEISGCVVGAITGNQTITLSGDASGSGSTSITVTVANDSHDHATTISGKAANVSDADLGDVTISSGSWAVENDSHSHTSTTLPATTSYLGSSIETGEITNGTIVTADINWDAFVVADGSINWAVQVPLYETDPEWSAWNGSSGINWEAAIGGINWTLIDTVKLNGINWDYYAGGGTSVWGENDSTAYYTDGNVGVGVSVATQALHVSGGVRLASLNCSGNANGGALTTDANGVVSCSDDDSGAGSGVNTGVINSFAYYPAAGTTVDDQTVLYLGGGGSNIGIGTTTPSEKLEVSGVVKATSFTGNLTGTASTATTANAGDSASSFFSSGTIEHERGGLEADVSAYNGFVKISGGSTSAVTASGGTDITADLEEETHASEHAVSAADTVFPADPNADKFLMWDDDPGALSWQTVSQEWTETGGILAPTTGTDDVAVDTNVFYVDVSANNVGVGTSTPSQKLQVIGTVIATAFSGPLTGNVTGDLTGNASTATTASTANAGDSATAFFSSGTIEHERGGLEADVSAYNGFIKISGGSTSAVSSDGSGDCASGAVCLGDHTHSSYITGNQSITLSGDASGSGTTAITVTVADDSHDHVYSNIDATTSSNWTSRVSDETGTGAWVFATGPTLAGNVGIGATGPNELSVVGEVAIGTTAYTNRAAPTSGILVEGNVGIGTTATVNSKLVVGGTSGIVSFTGMTSDPCSTAPVGSLFYNSTANVLCYCNGSNADIQVGVGSTTPCF